MKRLVDRYEITKDPETGEYRMVLSVRERDRVIGRTEPVDGDWLAHALPETDDAPVAFSSGREYTVAPDLLDGLRKQRRTFLQAMAGHGQQVAG